MSSRGRSRLQPGHLNTAEERREMRLLLRDLQARAQRVTNPDQLRELDRQIESVKREQAYDKQVSPRKKRKPQS